MTLYKDYEDWWRNGQHGYSSASREYAKEIWADLEETIMAKREDWERLLIFECKKERENFISYLRDFTAYLEEFGLVEIAGVNFHKWVLDRRLGRDKKSEVKALNTWERVLVFFRGSPLGEPITRGEYMRLQTGEASSSYIRLDEYRGLLTRAGYVQTVKRGVYIVVKKIPKEGLTYRGLRRSLGKQKDFQ